MGYCNFLLELSLRGGMDLLTKLKYYLSNIERAIERAESDPLERDTWKSYLYGRRDELRTVIFIVEQNYA